MSLLRKPQYEIFRLWPPFIPEGKTLKIISPQKSPLGDLGVKRENRLFGVNSVINLFRLRENEAFSKVR